MEVSGQIVLEPLFKLKALRARDAHSFLKFTGSSRERNLFTEKLYSFTRMTCIVCRKQGIM